MITDECPTCGQLGFLKDDLTYDPPPGHAMDGDDFGAPWLVCPVAHRRCVVASEPLIPWDAL